MGKGPGLNRHRMETEGLDEHPLYDLIVQAANANDPEIDSLVERVLTEAPLCTCKSVLDDQVGHYLTRF